MLAAWGGSASPVGGSGCISAVLLSPSPRGELQVPARKSLRVKVRSASKEKNQGLGIRHSLLNPGPPTPL